MVFTVHLTKICGGLAVGRVVTSTLVVSKPFEKGNEGSVVSLAGSVATIAIEVLTAEPVKGREMSNAPRINSVM